MKVWVIMEGRNYKVVEIKDEGETIILCDAYGRETTKTLTEILSVGGHFVF